MITEAVENIGNPTTTVSHEADSTCPRPASKTLSQKELDNLIFPAIVDPRVEVIIIFCVDPRFPLALDGFVKALGLEPGQYIVLRVAGGPAPLAHKETMRNRCRYLVRQTLFDCEHFKYAKRVVLIGHEDCGYYHVVTKGDLRPGGNNEELDLPEAASLLGLVVPEKTVVEAYYFYFKDPSRTEIKVKRVV